MGESLNEIAVTGAEWPPAKERLARLREAVELIKLLWTEEVSSLLKEHTTILAMQQFMIDLTDLYLFILVRVDPSPQNSQGGLEMALFALLGKVSNCTRISSFQRLKKERGLAVILHNRANN